MLHYDYKSRLYAREMLSDKWFENAPTTELDVDLMRDVLENLKSFNATFKLQQATMALITQSTVSKAETARLKRVFEGLDENGDGKL